MIKYCKCGCGNIVTGRGRYIQYHNLKDLKHIENVRRRMIKNNPSKRPEIRNQISETLLDGYESGRVTKYWLGKTRSEDTKRKISEIQKGGHHSPRTEFKKGIIPHNKGKRTPEETRKKQRLKKINKNYEEIYGESMAKELKYKRRIVGIKRIEQQVLDGQPLIPFIGKYEKKILDIYEKFLTYSIIRQYKVRGYFIDGYCSALNLAIEVDEPAHFNGKGELREKDIMRQKEIENELKCKFLRIKVPQEA